MVGAIIKHVVALLAAVADLFRDRQLIEAGRAQERAATHEANSDAVEKAKAASDDVVRQLDDHPDWVRAPSPIPETKPVACEAFARITFSRLHDTEETIIQIKAYNAARDALCGEGR